MEVVIAGATGLVGTALAKHLIAKGHRVTALTRDATTAAERLPTGCHWRVWDARNPGEWEESVARADVVVNLAGENIGAGLWTKRRKERILHSRLRATEALVHAMQKGGRAREQRLISASGKDFYGHRRGELLTERSVKGRGFLADVCQQWEDAAAKMADDGGDVHIIRLGMVLSAGAGSALGRMQLPFKMYVGGPIGDGYQWVSWIHIADVVGMMTFIADGKADAVGEEGTTGGNGRVTVWNGVAPRPVTMRTFAKTLGRAMGRPAFFRVPGRLVRLAMGEMADLILCSQHVDPVQARKSSFQWLFPDLNSALADVVDDAPPSRRLPKRGKKRNLGAQ